jgi:hypothetical protein
LTEIKTSFTEETSLHLAANEHGKHPPTAMRLVACINPMAFIPQWCVILKPSEDVIQLNI